MFKASPTLRISLGVLSLTVSLLLAAQLFGLLPDLAQAEIDARKQVSEALAVQLSLATVKHELPLVTATLEAVVERDEDVVSAGLRQADGKLLVTAGDHARLWLVPPDGRSTPIHIQVPIFQGKQRWGALELSFTPLKSTVSLARLASFRHSVVGLLVFVTLAGFAVYFVFLRRALRELDPATVIPERVKAAFDALSEGVLIMDEKEQIILANAAFAGKVERAAESLIGHKVSELDWRPWKAGDGVENLPWRRVLGESGRQSGVPLLMCAPSGVMLSFMVNCAPILDGKGKTRGVLGTFDDITHVEERNAELQRANEELKQSRDEVSRKNNELRFLATRDSLTGCLNRRAFFECCETAFAEALQQDQPLSCIMLDIDHFKSVNDRYGHAAGDKVISYVAEVLQAEFRTTDLVGRYGGEEYCVILPGLAPAHAVQLAERVRRRIREGIGARLEPGLRVTVSLGVTALEYGAQTPLELVNQADMALYAAKETGRNRVARWNETLVAQRVDAVASRAAGGGQRLAPAGRDAARTGTTRRLRLRAGDDHAVAAPGAETAILKLAFDPVTGLPAPLLFRDRVEQLLAGAQRQGTPAALLCVGIETLRRIQDTLGPAVGDELLKSVGERLGALVRRTDTVSVLHDSDVLPAISRTEHDEFVVVLGSLSGTEAITWIVQRMLESLATRFEIAGHEIYLTSTIGIALFPGDADTMDGLLRCASAARSHVTEEAGPNRYAFFAPEMNEVSYREIQLDAQMRHAVESGEFRLHYQPKIDLRSGRITAVEALIRWQHPEQGLISPFTFLPIAERTGFITVIGDWVLRTACQQVRQWRQAGIDDVQVAVNISAVQLRAHDFVGKLVSMMAETGVAPASLELELTETALMQDMDGAVRQLRELRRIGTRIAIDDFGTGYSALSYLKEFAADTLKIDGSFVADIATDSNDAALVAAIIAMAHRLGLTAVAEGVENEAQLAHLRSLQCDAVQGYLFSRPVPAEELLPLLISGEPLLAPPQTDLTSRMFSTLQLSRQKLAAAPAPPGLRKTQG